MENTDIKLRPWGLPGIGGSLGQCAVCGESFVTEIIISESLESFSVKGIPHLLYAHDACIDTLKEITSTDSDWKRLPSGPLRKAFEEQEAGS